MFLYNATATRTAQPRLGMLNCEILWPKDPWPTSGRDKLPTDDHIRATLHAAGECEAFYMDDAHRLARTRLAQLLARAADLAKKPIVLYGWPGSAGFARNLLSPKNYHWATGTYDTAQIMASIPAWNGKPLGYYTAAVCPSCYVTPAINQYAEQLTLFEAWQLVFDHVLFAAQIVAVACGKPDPKPIWPFVNLPPGLGITPEQVIGHCERRGIERVIIWDSAENKSGMNRLL